MATTIQVDGSVSKLNHEYSTSWYIKEFNSMGQKSIKTPAFSPIPNSDATFYFELWHEFCNVRYNERTFLKIILFKSPGKNILQSMKMNVALSICNYCNNTLKRYEHNVVNVSKMKSVVIINESVNRYHYNEYKKEHILLDEFYSFKDYSSVTIKCQLLFYEHLSSPADYFREMQSLKNLKKFALDFDDIYQNSFLSDINFEIKDELLPAHKSILSAHSPVFRRMISSEFLESKTDTVVINDSTPEVFKCFLKYLYSAEVEDKTWPVVKELFKLADKYDVCTLKSECHEIIACLLSVDNTCEILKIAHDYEDDYLKKEATLFAVQHFQELSQRDDWKEFIKSDPLIIYDVMMHLAPKSS